MRLITGLLLTLAIAILISSGAKSQENNAKENYSAYDLMSKYYNENFKPFKKRNVYLGLAFSLDDVRKENTTGLFQNILDGKELDYNIELKGGYFFGNYAMAGLNFQYTHHQFTGSVFRDPDTLQSNSLTRAYDLTPNFRAAIPLTKNERLSFFVEIGLTFGYSTGLVRNTKNLDEVDKLYSEGFHFRAGLSPGITFFAIESFAFEVQLNVLGYDLMVTHQTQNDEIESKVTEQQIDANINLLSLQLGLAYNFGSKK